MFDETDVPFSFSIAFYMNSRWGTTATTGIFIAAAITDWLDGYIARKVCNVFFLKLWSLNKKSDGTLCVFYEHDTTTWFDVFQMRLGSAFGAFLDPVADKVHTLFFDIVSCWLALVKFMKAFWICIVLDWFSCLLNAAHGCCHLSLVVYTTLGSSYVWTSTMATACTCNCNNR